MIAYFLFCEDLMSLVGQEIELDSVGRQFEPYLTAGCVCMLVAPLWCDLGKLRGETPALTILNFLRRIGVGCLDFAVEFIRIAPHVLQRYRYQSRSLTTIFTCAR